MWLHGFDVDPATGRLYVAVAAYGPPPRRPAGTIQVGRSDDRGETWSFATLPAAPEAAAADSRASGRTSWPVRDMSW